MDHATGVTPEPLHPVLTDVTIGAWTSSFFLDLVGGHRGRAASRRPLGLGVLSAVPTIASGAADWLDVDARTQRVGVVHALTNATATLLYAWLFCLDQGQVAAMGDTCSHQGAPLRDGTVIDGCVRCPWHGSEFRLIDGTVASGPATSPQPKYDTRLVGVRYQVHLTRAPSARCTCSESATGSVPLPRTRRGEGRASLDELQLPRDIQSMERVVGVRLPLTRVGLLGNPPTPACRQPCAGSSAEASCMAFEVGR